jgi:alpha/beta superfamily hydrolase
MSTILLPRNARQFFIDGPCGILDTLELQPKESPRGVAIVFHPDPKGGGTYTNKIVQSVAKVMNNKGYLSICPNLRSVGMSVGEHDFGKGEIEDGLAVYQYVRANYPDLPIVLAGFSFGTGIASQVAAQSPHQKLILIGPAVTRYAVVVPDKANTLVIHGQEDEVIPLENIYEWAAEIDIPVTIFAKSGHFFHGKLVQLQSYLNNWLVV